LNEKIKKIENGNCHFNQRTYANIEINLRAVDEPYQFVRVQRVEGILCRLNDGGAGCSMAARLISRLSILSLFLQVPFFMQIKLVLKHKNFI